MSLIRRVTAVGVLLILPAVAVGQSDQDTPTLQRTAWGDPDLQEIWDFRTLTPMERPSEHAGKEFLTDEEAAVFIQGLPSSNWDTRERWDREKSFGFDGDLEHGYNQFWLDFGTNVTDEKRTSLIVDPPDGRIPWVEGIEFLPDGRLAWVEGQEKPGGYGDAFLGRLAAGPEDRPLAERCILGLNSGPPMNPSVYNNNVQLLQTPDTVVIFNEMVHNARIIPMDGRPHLPREVRQWIGDSRGHWEGDTQVVETTNFLGATHLEGSSANLHLVERFTRVGAESLVYEFTVEDSRMWTKPWTARIPMKKTDGPMFEYACHEENYSMPLILSGARAQEKAAEDTARTGSR